MSKKQIAALVAAALTTIAGVLTQCPDQAPAPAPTSAPAADAGTAQ